MNLLFGLATAGTTALVAWFVLRMIVRVTIQHRLFPKEFESEALLVRGVLTGAIFLAVFWSSFATYGPRVQLPAAQLPRQPEPQTLEPEDDIFAQKDRSTTFSDRLENEGQP